MLLNKNWSTQILTGGFVEAIMPIYLSSAILAVELMEYALCICVF
jgi:hypothetical protein